VTLAGISGDMKAIAVTPEKHRVDIIDHPEPVLRESRDVKVRILDVGVCGTDREICSFEYGTPPAHSDMLIIGHESLGEVVEVGRAVTRVRPGDLVVTMVRRPCLHEVCVGCRSERQDFCYTGDFHERGIKEEHGFMTEMIVDDEAFMNVVPPALRDVGVLVEPLTIGEKALEQIRQVQQRLPWACPELRAKGRGHCHRALVLGAGPVGLLGAMALAADGFDTHVYSREPAGSPKAKLVESFGCRYVCATDTPIKALPDTIGNLDVVYEATGASRVSFEIMKVLGVNGVFVFTGVPGRKAPAEIDTDLIMRNLVLKNQVVFGTVNAGRETFEAAIRDLGRFMELWPAAVRALISGRFPVSAYRDLLLGAPSGIKNVILFA
jgi:threonine dehydrogenase-like Zn-dependent dehydrogenase